MSVCVYIYIYPGEEGEREAQQVSEWGTGRGSRLLRGILLLLLSVRLRSLTTPCLPVSLLSRSI